MIELKELPKDILEDGGREESNSSKDNVEVSFGHTDTENEDQDNSNKRRSKWGVLVGTVIFSILAATAAVSVSKGYARKRIQRKLPKNPTLGISFPRQRDLYTININLPTDLLPPPTTPTPPTPPQDTVPSPDTLDVLIVGAGWSGLAAAETLVQNSQQNFIILEAADYVGGRTNSQLGFRDQQGSAIPVPIELGSEWSYDKTAIHGIAEQLNINAGATTYAWEKTNIYEDYRLRQMTNRQNEDALVPKADKQAMLDELWDGGYAKEAQKSGNGRSYDQIMEDYLDETEQTPFRSAKEDRQFLNSFLNYDIETEWGAPLDDISVSATSFSLDNQENSNYLTVPGGGYKRLVETVSAPLRNKIKLRSKVLSIDYSDANIVQVRYVDPTGRTKIERARKVLVTASVGVLQQPNSLQFNPPLSNEKKAAIQNIGMGNLNKIVLYWRGSGRAFWPDQQWLTLATYDDDTSGLWTTFFNPRSQWNTGSDDYAILVGWAGGDDADTVENFHPDEATNLQINLDIAVGNLREMFGNNIPYPDDYVMSGWGSNEFTQGSYSYDKRTTNSQAARQVYAQNVGNLYFAGEATDTTWYGTTEGAYQSGSTAAQQMMKDL